MVDTKVITAPKQQHEALRLADALCAESESSIKSVKYSTAKKSAAELRRQHAEIALLTADNEALKAKNQPLSIQAISEIADEMTAWIDLSNGKYVIDDYFSFARAIEASHGIGEKP